jgi:hypothetical protein
MKASLELLYKQFNLLIFNSCKINHFVICANCLEAFMEESRVPVNTEQAQLLCVLFKLLPICMYLSLLSACGGVRPTR